MTSRRPTFLIKLRPEVGVDGLRALKAALRRLLRDHGLRCLEVRQEPPAGARRPAPPRKERP